LVYIALDGKLKKIIGLKDTIKKESKRLVQELKKLNLKVYMATGDNENSAKEVASEIGINEENVFSNCIFLFYLGLPDDKTQKIIHLQNLNEKVIMVGDGNINFNFRY
jgi:P-type Cu+ transporter